MISSSEKIFGRTAPAKIYLSGPMKGYPDSNYPAFHSAAKRLRDAGHLVYNPAEYPHDGPHSEFPIREAFADYCRYICLEATHIVLLEGWEKSLGVRAELALAENCSLGRVQYVDFLSFSSKQVSA